MPFEAELFHNPHHQVNNPLPGNIVSSIDDFLNLIDKYSLVFMKESKIPLQENLLMKRLEYAVLVDNYFVHIVYAYTDSSSPRHFYFNYPNVNYGTENFKIQLERNHSLVEGQFFKFPKSHLSEDREENAKSISKELFDTFFNNRQMAFEEQKNIIRIKPIFQGRDFRLDKNLAFVLSPFNEDFNIIYVDHIKPTVERSGLLNCQRADSIYNNKSIMEDVWRKINESAIIISDLTSRNPNVFYETGIAHTVGKEVLLITQTMDDVPFDLKHLRCIIYNNSPRGMKTFEDQLELTVRSITETTD